MMLVVSLLLGLMGLYVLRWALQNRKKRTKLPPGPAPKPIIGNLLDLPPAGTPDWLHWFKHKELYGPISSVTLFGQTIIIINDLRVALDLMEKRSVLHSCRPHMVMAEITNWTNALGILPYSSRLRACRKALHQEMGTVASISKYHSIVDMETHRLLLRVLRNPDDLIQHIRMRPQGHDPLVKLVDEAMGDFSQLTLPGAWLVNFVPMLKYVPSWFPGGGFQKTAKAYKERVTAMADMPYEFVQRQMARQNQVPSLVSRLREQGVEPGSEEDWVIKWSAQSLYGGGAETSVSLLMCFFLAMALYPDVQKKAREEIDRVVGTGRLPSFSDRDNLPYVNAVVKEVLRWHPATPIAVPHASSEDDIYRGYLIPKGATLVPNIWGFTHDPTLYHDPAEFKPERFLDGHGRPAEYDPHLLAFGFGRRICPGQHLASVKAYMAVVRILAVFHITPLVKDGKEVPIHPKFLPGLISHPAPFDLSIQVRSPEHERLVRMVEKIYPWEKSHAGELAHLDN
ncbi:cytochrome P450 [Aspergillus coremiiformis]|uniref:Cytochrome P450 n=1 Tax=Aspergillus coremiiformis TaxID=138285 RepID=A0A5N6YUV2_9EURO|nr:cytochrome P450 [Aspergillus coremiiformis]